jgi:hypothetical protein
LVAHFFELATEAATAASGLEKANPDKIRGRPIQKPDRPAAFSGR